jgi:hypothetical protein
LTLFLNEVHEDVRAQMRRPRLGVWSTIRGYNSEADYEIDVQDLPPLDEGLGELDEWS